jgi:excisionase family DNA binding protein
MILIELTKAEIQHLLKAEITAALASQGSKAEDTLLSRTDTAKYLGVTLPTLHAWEKKGYIKPIRLGSRVYFKKSSLVRTNI